MANVSNKLIGRANLLMQQEKWWNMVHLTGVQRQFGWSKDSRLPLMQRLPNCCTCLSRPWSRGTSQTSLHQHAGSKKIRCAFHFHQDWIVYIAFTRHGSTMSRARWIFRRIAKLVGLFHPNCRGILQCSCHGLKQHCVDQWGPVDSLERCHWCPLMSIGKSWTILHTNNVWLYNW